RAQDGDRSCAPCDGAGRPLENPRVSTIRTRLASTIDDVRTMLRQRVAQAGAQLDLLVLAAEPAGCIGVDVASGAFVRARYPAATRLLRPFQIARGRLAHDEVPDAAQPELVDLTDAPRPAGRLAPRRAERWLRPLLHPPRLPLLGFSGNAV